MGFDERFGWLLLGMALGYIIRTLQDIRKEGREVHRKIVRKERGEGGFMRYPLVADVALLLVMAMCVYASFSTQLTNNRLEDAVKEIKAGQIRDDETQARLARVTICTQEYLAQTIEALNERTAFTQKQANSNVELQKAQRDFLAVLMTRPPVSEEEAQAAVRSYVESLQRFVEVAAKQKGKTDNFPYPTEEALTRCLDSGTIS